MVAVGLPSVEELRPPDANGLGRRVRLHTKGWLPYTLTWEFEIVESRYPHGYTLVATGDFDGRGVWTFEQDGAFVDATYDWRLSAEKPLLRNLSFLLKPVFEANHRWAMAQGEQSLKLELARRRATSDAARARSHRRRSGHLRRCRDRWRRGRGRRRAGVSDVALAQKKPLRRPS